MRNQSGRHRRSAGRGLRQVALRHRKNGANYLIWKKSGGFHAGFPNIYRRKKIGNRVLGFGLLVFFLFIACAAFMFFYQEEYPNLSILLSAAWVVLVPVYFFI
jgi:hypothetical protein